MYVVFYMYFIPYVYFDRQNAYAKYVYVHVTTALYFRK